MVMAVMRTITIIGAAFPTSSSAIANGPVAAATAAAPATNGFGFEASGIFWLWGPPGFRIQAEIAVATEEGTAVARLGN